VTYSPNLIITYVVLIKFLMILYFWGCHDMDTSTPNMNTLKKLILWKLFKIKKVIQGLKMTFMNYSRWPKAVESELGRGGKWEWHGGSGQTCGDSSALVAPTDKDEILKPVESSSLAPPLPFYTDNEFHRHSRRGIDARKTLSFFLYRFSLSSRVLGCCCCCCCRCLLMVVGWMMRGEDGGGTVAVLCVDRCWQWLWVSWMFRQGWGRQWSWSVWWRWDRLSCRAFTGVERNCCLVKMETRSI